MTGAWFRARAATVVVVAVASAGMLVADVTPARAATPSPSGTDAQCTRFVQLRDVVLAVNGATTGREALAAIKKASRAFRRAADRAPEAIAKDMALLAKSFSELDRALRPLASDLRSARNGDASDGVLTHIHDVFSRWAATQDTAALGEAQTAVDDWVAAECGFRLAPDTTTETTTPTPTTTVAAGR